MRAIRAAMGLALGLLVIFAASATAGPETESMCIPSPHLNFNSYQTAYTNLYGSAPHACSTCHLPDFSGKNPYGTDMQNTAGANATARLQAIENLDSDGDGTSNRDEALAGRNPGDPNDAPPPAGPAYVGSTTCASCHTATYANWRTSLHSSIYMPPIDPITQQTTILPVWSGIISVEQTGSNARPPVWARLDQEGNNWYVRLFRDNGVTPLTGSLEIVRVHGGRPIPENGNDSPRNTAGTVRGLRSANPNPIYPGGPDHYPGESIYIGKQRYQVEFGDQHYILPIQYNPVSDLDRRNGGWVPYNVHNWIDAGYNLVLNASQSEERKCAGCHQTGIVDVTYDADSMATIPGTAHTITGAYELVGNPAVEENITCEACHGPGSDHVAGGYLGEPGSREIIQPFLNLTRVQQTDACGFCHSRGVSVGQVNGMTLEYPFRNTEPRMPLPGDVWADYYVEGGGYWPDGVHARQHHQQYEEFIASGHFNRLSCTTRFRSSGNTPGCHDAHGTANEHDLTQTARGVASANQPSDNLCWSCHQTRAFPLNTDTDRERHTWHDPQSIRGVADCTNCHMPAMASSGVAYDIHSHTFHAVQPEETIAFNQPNSCAILCHRTFGMPQNDTRIGVWNDPSDIANAAFLQEHVPGATLIAQYLAGEASVEALVHEVPAYGPALDPNRDTDDVTGTDASPFNINAADLVTYLNEGRP